VAAWLSETVLRGRGSGASGFESHRRGNFFSKEGTSAGPWMCVCLSGLTDGRVVESDTLPTPQGSNPGRMGLPWMLCCIRVVSSRKEKGERRKEKRGWDRKVPDWPGYVACSSSTCNSPSVQFGMHSRPEEDRQYQRESAIAPVHTLLMSPQYLGTGITS
jgi:hypothetical protein